MAYENEKQGAPNVAAVVVAAGRGERAGSPEDGPKQYRLIGGRPVIRHTLEALLGHEAIGIVAVAIHADDEALFSSAVEGLGGRVIAVRGGATRQDSTRLALEAIAGLGPDRVLIHDGVRPFIDRELLGRIIGAIAPGEGALPTLPVSDTLKREDGSGTVTGTVDRKGLHAAQTPQGFMLDEILTAHGKAAEAGRDDFTDDASIAEWAGIPVRIVRGSPDNIKLTWGRDIVMADEKLSRKEPDGYPDVRCGTGYDVHSFVEGDHVTLCGVRIAHDRGLNGHSDSDVGLHALTDALLATCAAGDIGTHFPPSDPQWKGAASSIFLAHAARLIREKGGRIANVDVTLVCEAPKIGPHRTGMVAAISSVLGIGPDRISIKATTNEKLGFLGRGEGIAALASASVVYAGTLPA